MRKRITAALCVILHVAFAGRAAAEAAGTDDSGGMDGFLVFCAIALGVLLVVIVLVTFIKSKMKPVEFPHYTDVKVEPMSELNPIEPDQPEEDPEFDPEPAIPIEPSPEVAPNLRPFEFKVTKKPEHNDEDTAPFIMEDISSDSFISEPPEVAPSVMIEVPDTADTGSAEMSYGYNEDDLLL